MSDKEQGMLSRAARELLDQGKREGQREGVAEALPVGRARVNRRHLLPPILGQL